MVGLRPTIFALGRASELAFPSLNQMVQLSFHISKPFMRLLIPVVPVDAALVFAGHGSAGVLRVVIMDAGTFSAGAGADDVCLLNLYDVQRGLLINFLFHNC